MYYFAENVCNNKFPHYSKAKLHRAEKKEKLISHMKLVLVREAMKAKMPHITKSSGWKIEKGKSFLITAKHKQICFNYEAFTKLVLLSSSLLIL